LSERKLAIEDRLSRTEIRSPVSGYVNELSVHTVGGVITPAAKIATIVPQNAELKFEIKIAPADIDEVREGQPARVRLTAFNRTTTPEMKARVVMVSPASARDPTNGQQYYIAYRNLLPTEDAMVQLNGMKLVPACRQRYLFRLRKERWLPIWQTFHRSDESRLPRTLSAFWPAARTELCHALTEK
jgi:multidrug efflux pump subunit AcrA (membrane-fusion protein)